MTSNVENSKNYRVIFSHVNFLSRITMSADHDVVMMLGVISYTATSHGGLRIPGQRFSKMADFRNGVCHLAQNLMFVHFNLNVVILAFTYRHYFCGFYLT